MTTTRRRRAGWRWAAVVFAAIVIVATLTTVVHFRVEALWGYTREVAAHEYAQAYRQMSGAYRARVSLADFIAQQQALIDRYGEPLDANLLGATPVLNPVPPFVAVRVATAQSYGGTILHFRYRWILRRHGWALAAAERVP